MAAPIAHGGGLIAAHRQFPHAPQPWIDLSTGINPVAYPLPPLPVAAMTRLPEPEQLAALEAVAARAYGARDPACVVAAPGTQALIQLLPSQCRPGPVAVLSPTYAEHRAAWARTGQRVAEVATLAQAASAAIIVVVRPNNPDGALVDGAELSALASGGRLVIVDEAFADLESCSMASLVPAPGLILLRSFGKTYGLAGLRLGFALTSPERARALREAFGPWAVSGPALHAGLHALADEPWRRAAATRLADDAARLDGMLQRAGGRVIGGTRLFRLVDHPRAAILADRLGEAGILVRRFPDHPTWLRFGIPGPLSDWGRLHAALFRL